MQLSFTITPEQEGWIKIIIEAGFFPFVGWLIKASRTKINGIITDNVNRISGDLQIHLDQKFKEHEDNAFPQLEALQQSVNELTKQLNKLQEESKTWKNPTGS